jgi:hypothetical protein
MNEAYQLEVVLFSKWRIYSFKSDQIRTAIIYLQLANARFTTSYSVKTLFNQSITVNTIISMLSVRILRLFRISFGSYGT